MDIQIIVTNEQEWNGAWDEDIRAMLAADVMERIAEDGARIFANAWRLKEIVHNKTGQYQQNITVVPVDKGEGFAEMSVQTDLAPPYDFYLEYGTSRMHAIPIMRPAYDSVKDRVEQVLEEGLARNGEALG